MDISNDMYVHDAWCRVMDAEEAFDEACAQLDLLEETEWNGIPWGLDLAVEARRVTCDEMDAARAELADAAHDAHTAGPRC